MKYWDNETIDKIRNGYYSAVYFNRTKQTLLKEKKLENVTMQIFQKQNSVLCGVDQVIELLKIGTGYFENEKWIDKSSELEINSLADGDSIKPLETIMHIKGPYAYFAHLESLYLGILARQTKIATNVKKVVTAAKNKQIIFFADRFDYFLNQEIDGYAAKIGGIHGVATAAQAHLIQKQPMGTIPHAFIAINDGDTVETAGQFSNNFPDVPLIVLVDFENDCVKTSLEVAKKFGDKLFGVRLDTSESITDKSSKEKGVNPELVKKVRDALDDEGFNKVKIVVSGGFNAEKIEKFEKESVPVDIYGVGSSLLTGNIDFTADIVEVENKKIAKTGRIYRPNENLCKKLM